MAWRDDQRAWLNGAIPSEETATGGARTHVKSIPAARGSNSSPPQAGTGAYAEGEKTPRRPEHLQSHLGSPERQDSPNTQLALRNFRREALEDNGPYLVVRRELRRDSGYPISGQRSHAGFYSDMSRNPRKTEILYIRSPVLDRGGAAEEEEEVLAPRSVSENDAYRSRPPRGLVQRQNYGRPGVGNPNELYHDSTDYAGYSRYPGEMPGGSDDTAQSMVPRSRFRQNDIRHMVPISEASLRSSNPGSDGYRNIRNNENYGQGIGFRPESLEIQGHYTNLDPNMVQDHTSRLLVMSHNSGRSSNNASYPQFYVDEQMSRENINPSIYRQELSANLNRSNIYPNGESMNEPTGEAFENNHHFISQNNLRNRPTQNSYEQNELVRNDANAGFESSTANAESQTPPDLYNRKKSSNHLKISHAGEVQRAKESEATSDAAVPPRRFRSVEDISNLQELRNDRKFKSQDDVAHDPNPRQRNAHELPASEIPGRQVETRRNPGSDKRAALVTNTPIDHIEKEMLLDEDDALKPRDLRRMLDGRSTLDNECDERKLQRRVGPETRLEKVLYDQLRSGERPVEMNDYEVVYDGQGDMNDSDSGIGGVGRLKLKNSNYMEKKSVFTIAYDGIQTRRLKSEDGRTGTP